MWKITLYDKSRGEKTVRCNVNDRGEAESLARVLELIYANKRVIAGTGGSLMLSVNVVDGEPLKDSDVTFEDALLWVLNGKNLVS